MQQQHHQGCLLILGFVASLQKVAKKCGDLKEDLDFTLCTNIIRIAQVTCLPSYRTSLLSSAILKLVCNISVSVTIHVINMLVALCTTLWSSTYFSPSSQLKYFLQGCAISAILSLSITYFWYNIKGFYYN